MRCDLFWIDLFYGFGLLVDSMVRVGRLFGFIIGVESKVVCLYLFVVLDVVLIWRI